MKFQIPQISWHGRKPVLSVDFQPIKGNMLRLASGGADSHVLIWYLTHLENKTIEIKFASDLYRHNRSVNVVRFSPNGDLLASGDDEGALFLWQLKEQEGQYVPKDEDDVNQEEWSPLKLLRGHLEDIYDISWSADSNFLLSGSMDNTAILWDMQKFQKLHIFSDSKGYIQGCAYDPLNMYLATIGTDRTLRIMNVHSKKTTYKIQRAPWTVTTEKGTFKARLFHDDTLKSFFRRLCFTPDGEALIVPSGILEKDDKSVNATYIFSRHIPNKPAAYLLCGDKYTVAVRCNPVLYKLRDTEKDSKCLLNLPYRMIFAVAARDSVFIYDTQRLTPIKYVSNIHYANLTDLAWSSDGRILVASSTDGYCSLLIFDEQELGEVYIPPTPPPSPKKEEMKAEPVIKTCEKENKPDDSVLEKTKVIAKKTVPISPKEKEDKKEKRKKEESPNVLKIKKPKVTIESFFTSPKVKPITALTVKTEPIFDEVKDMKTSEMPSSVSESKTGLSLTDTDRLEKNKFGSFPMEIDKAGTDSCSVELVYEGKSTKDPSKPLSFANKIKSCSISENITKPDLDDSDAVSSFDELSQNVNNSDVVVKDNDWKLELSQDDEPMDVSKTEITKTPEAPKPKRRINLITLSKTVTKTPPQK